MRLIYKKKGSALFPHWLDKVVSVADKAVSVADNAVSVTDNAVSV